MICGRCGTLIAHSATRRVRPRLVLVETSPANPGWLRPPGRPLEAFPQATTVLAPPPVCARCLKPFEAEEDLRDQGFRDAVTSLCAVAAAFAVFLMLFPHALKDAVDSLSDRPPNTLLPPTYNPARPPIPERTPSLEPPTP